MHPLALFSMSDSGNSPKKQVCQVSILKAGPQLGILKPTSQLVVTQHQSLEGGVLAEIWKFT